MTALFKPSSNGAYSLCRGCRRVHEGTAGFAITHHRQCQHQRLYDALYRHELLTARASDAFINVSYDSDTRAELVFAILGESDPPVYCLICSLRHDQHAAADHLFEVRP